MTWVTKIRISTLTVLLAAVCAAPGAGQLFRPRPEEPSCAGQPKGTACWMELESHPRCYVWTSRLIPAATVTWSAGCTDGLAQGTGTLTWKWANGEYEVSGILRAGKQHGHWVLRDANGTVAEGPYEDGEKTGRWIERFANGNLGEGPYVNGMAHGRWVFRLANGRVQELPYVDGKKHGRWIERYLNGQVNEGPWVDGKRHGRWVFRSPDGSTETLTFVNGEPQ